MSNIIPTNTLNPKPSFKSWGIFTLWVAELMARSQWEGGTRPTNADDRLESQPVILWRRRNTVEGYSNLLNRSWRLEGFKKILLASSEWLFLSPTMIVQYSSGETKYDLNLLVDKMLVPADRPSVLHFCLLGNQHKNKSGDYWAVVWFSASAQVSTKARVRGTTCRAGNSRKCSLENNS